MIFVTIGTQYQRFDRIFDYINQLDISKYLDEQNHCFVAKDLDEFNEVVRGIDEYKFNKYVSNEKEFIKNVSRKLELLLED